MQTNSTKAKLQAGETVFGCFVRYADASLVEMMGYQNWDFLVFDAEHGTLEPRECEHLGIEPWRLSFSFLLAPTKIGCTLLFNVEKKRYAWQRLQLQPVLSHDNVGSALFQ